MKLYCMTYDLMFDSSCTVGKQEITFVAAGNFEEARKTLAEYQWQSRNRVSSSQGLLSRLFWGKRDSHFVIDNLADEDESFLGEILPSDVSRNVITESSLPALDFDYRILFKK